MPFTFVPTALPGVIIIEPTVFADDRGFFMETYKKSEFVAAGLDVEFVQENHSRSVQGTLRGLHLQRAPKAQGKLVRAIVGEVFDVAVDMRRSSLTFGQSMSCVLSAANKRMLWIPPGFAHGFLVTSDVAEFVYKTTDYWYPAHERTLLWNDSALRIDWPPGPAPSLAAKDAAGKPFATADAFA